MAETTNKNRQEIFKRIDDLQAFMKSERNKNLLFKEVFGDKKMLKTKRNKDYQLISRIINKEYGISETTVWRLLRIKEKDLITYNKLRNSKASIKEGYENLYRNTDTQAVKDGRKVGVKNSQETINFSLVEANLKELLFMLENNNIEEVNNSQLIEIDGDLFKLRKALGKLISKNMEKD